MPTESELRTFLQEETSDAERRMSLDTRAILRRVRRRRLPRQIAVGGSVALAAAGIGVASVQGLTLAGTLGGTSGVTSGVGSSPESVEESAPGSGGDLAAGGAAISLAPAEKLNFCGAAPTEVTPSVTGLVLTTAFPDGAPANGSPVTGIVTLTNTGGERVTGTTSATPAITLSGNGVVLWHSNGPTIAMAILVDLGPGESLQYQAAFMPVRCEVEDDSAESFRENLPAVAAGTYDVSAAIAIALDAPVNGSSPVDLITGPRQAITLG